MDVKRGREEIWKGIREREQLIRRGKQWDGEREREGGGLGQGGTREEKRQIVALGRERITREERGKRGRCRKGGGRKKAESQDFG